MAWDDEEENLIRPNEKKNAEDEETEYVFSFIDDLDSWKKEWKGMPEFVQENLDPWKSIIIHFENREDMINFGKLIGLKINFETKSSWFPVKEREIFINQRWVDEQGEINEN